MHTLGASPCAPTQGHIWLHHRAIPTELLVRVHLAAHTCFSFTGLLTESRGSSGDALYTRVEQMIEAGTNRAAGREAAGSLAPENDPPLASAQDLIRQVSMGANHSQEGGSGGGVIRTCIHSWGISIDYITISFWFLAAAGIILKTS